MIVFNIIIMQTLRTFELAESIQAIYRTLSQNHTIYYFSTMMNLNYINIDALNMKMVL